MTADARVLVMPHDREAGYLRLLRTHGPAIRRLAGSYERDAARRDDLVQDILLALWEAWPRFRGEASERTFVFRIAHNRGISHAIRHRRRAMQPIDRVEPATGDTIRTEPAADAESNPEHTASERERRDRLERAVRDLPIGMRQTVVLALEGLSHREIGQVLGLSEGAVAVRLSRARRALARRLGVQESPS